jgi:hypothetical protein
MNPKQNPEVIYEISAKQMIQDGHFTVIRQSRVERLGLHLPVIVSPGANALFNVDKVPQSLGCTLLLLRIVEHVKTAIKMGVSIHEKITMNFNGDIVMFVVQPLASDDQRPVLTVYLPDED